MLYDSGIGLGNMFQASLRLSRRLSGDEVQGFPTEYQKDPAFDPLEIHEMIG